jgi:hypothetical protein
MSAVCAVCAVAYGNVRVTVHAPRLCSAQCQWQGPLALALRLEAHECWLRVTRPRIIGWGGGMPASPVPSGLAKLPEPAGPSEPEPRLSPSRPDGPLSGSPISSAGDLPLRMPLAAHAGPPQQAHSACTSVLDPRAGNATPSDKPDLTCQWPTFACPRRPPGTCAT